MYSLRYLLLEGSSNSGAGKVKSEIHWTVWYSGSYWRGSVQTGFTVVTRGIHDVFHVSQLRKYVRNDSHVLDHSSLTLSRDLSYEVLSVAVIDKWEKVLKGKTITLVWVSWEPNHSGESTWDRKDDIRSDTRISFLDPQLSFFSFLCSLFILNFEDKISLLDGYDCNPYTS